MLVGSVLLLSMNEKVKMPNLITLNSDRNLGMQKQTEQL